MTSILKQVVNDKCVNGYGVPLAELEKLGWNVLGSEESAETGDLEENITEDGNFLGSLQIPMLTVGGDPIIDVGREFFRYRLFFQQPKSQFGEDTSQSYKKKRYRQSLGSKSHAWLPQHLDLIGMAEDARVPIILVEGEPKSVGLTLDSHFAIGLSGLDNFMPGGMLLPELEDIEWVGRQVFLAPDGDWKENVNVHGAIHRLARQVELLGGKVYVIDISELPEKGIDDVRREHGSKKIDSLLAEAKTFAGFGNLDVNTNNVARKTIPNYQLALSKMGWNFRYNEWTSQIEATTPGGAVEDLNDDQLASMVVECSVKFKVQPTNSDLVAIARHSAKLDTYNPVLEYLESCNWDGTPRIDHWLSESLGVAQTELNNAFARKTLLGAVARALKPGCKLDTVLVLIGKQGKGKSTAVSTLLPDEAWFSDGVDINEQGKGLMEKTRGVWIAELGELDGMTARAIAKTKANISRQVDTDRMSYDRLPSRIPRKFICIGTANDRQFLRDQTGNRRFWPVDCEFEKAELDWLGKHRDQLWAEAVVAVRAGESIMLPEHLWAQAEEKQDEYVLRSPQYQKLLEWLGKDAPGKVFTDTIWRAFGVDVISQRDAKMNHLIIESMASLGFVHKNKGMRICGSDPAAGFQRGEILKEKEHYWTDTNHNDRGPSLTYYTEAKSKGGRPPKKTSDNVRDIAAKKRKY